MLHITAILEGNTLTASYDYAINTWQVTICDSLTGQQKTSSLASDELASLLCLAVQNEQGIIPSSVIESLYPIAETVTSKFTDNTSGNHPLRIIP